MNISCMFMYIVNLCWFVSLDNSGSLKLKKHYICTVLYNSIFEIFNTYFLRLIYTYCDIVSIFYSYKSIPNTISTFKNFYPVLRVLIHIFNLYNVHMQTL